MVGTKSSATVQHRQPLVSSTMASSGQFSSAQPFRMSPSMPRSPNSLTRMASRRPCGFCMRWRTRVVLPAPRKPVMMVTGIFSTDIGLLPDRRDEWRDARDHALAEDRRPFPPRNQPIGGRGITRGAGQEVVDRGFAEVAIDVAPAAGPGQRSAAATAAVREALDLDNAKGRGAVLTVLGFGERVMQPPAVADHGIVFLAGTAGDADMQRHGTVLRYWIKRFNRNLRCRLVHSKARQWMASAHGAMTRQAASGPALRSTNPITPGRPAWNGDMAGDGRFPGSRVVAGTTFPGRNPVASGAGFPLTVAGAAPASPRFGNLIPYLERPVFPLSLLPDQNPEKDTVG